MKSIFAKNIVVANILTRQSEQDDVMRQEDGIWRGGYKN